MEVNDKITHEKIFEEFCKWNPIFADFVMKYKPWGSTSIVIWLNDGHAYKVKRYDSNKFIMQHVSKSDIDRKFNNQK